MDNSKRILVLAAARDDVAALRTFAAANGVESLRTTLYYHDLTILHYAAQANSVSVVRFLISDAIGADVNAARINNFTPLHAAAMSGSAEICKILLGCGANPDVQTAPQLYVPMHSAAWGGHLGAVDVLLQGGARTDLRNYRGETPPETARRQGHLAVAEHLEAVMRLH